MKLINRKLVQLLANHLVFYNNLPLEISESPEDYEFEINANPPVNYSDHYIEIKQTIIIRRKR